MSQKNKSSRKASDGVTDNEANFLVDVRKMGYLRKLKKMKKRFFVLRKASETGPARLEYYVSEKKWKTGSGPRRSIVLKTCFNIGRKLHSKNKFVVALYTQDDCFAIVMDCEEDLEQWLAAMHELQHDASEEDTDSKSKPIFEHVWQVVVDDKELEFSQDINGPHHLCLTSKVLSLVKMNSGSENLDILEFPLMSIRRCGHSGKYFFIELGRSAVTGAGGIWMETEATIIAQNMHETILGAMKSSRNREEQGSLSRPRSASTSENSKPIATRRPLGLSIPQSLSAVNPSVSSSRERCDSLPSRSQTFGEALPDAPYSPMSGPYVSTGKSYPKENLRPHSVYAWPSSNSPTCTNLSYSPGSLSASVCSTGSIVSFDEAESSQVPHCSRSPHSLPLDINHPSEHTITEVPGEYLMMSPSYEKKSQPSESSYSEGSRALCSSDAASSPKILVDYMEMSSPTNVREGYISMSVIGSLNAKTTLGRRQRVSSSDEKSPTLQHKGVKSDGYIPMAPGGVASDYDPVVLQDGYLDMSPRSSSLPKTTVPDSDVMDHKGHEENCNNLQEAELCTSFEESDVFVLDKVPSLVQQAEDTSADCIKPLCTYSIGNQSKVLGTRARACSVGNDSVKPTLYGLTILQQTGSLKDNNRFGRSLSAPALRMSTAKKHQNTSKSNCDDDLMLIEYSKRTENTAVVQNRVLMPNGSLQKSSHNVNGAALSHIFPSTFHCKTDENFNAQHSLCTDMNTHSNLVGYKKGTQSAKENNFVSHCPSEKCEHVSSQRTNINDLNSISHKLEGQCSEEASVLRSQIKENFIPNILDDTVVIVNNVSSKNFQNVGLYCSISQENSSAAIHQYPDCPQNFVANKASCTTCTTYSESRKGSAHSTREMQEHGRVAKQNVPSEPFSTNPVGFPRISRHESLPQSHKPRLPVPKISCGHVDAVNENVNSLHENVNLASNLQLNLATFPSDEDQYSKVADSPESGFDDDGHGDYVCLDIGQSSKYPLPSRKLDTSMYKNQNMSNVSMTEEPSDDHRYMNVVIGMGPNSYLDKAASRQDSVDLVSARAVMNNSPVSPSRQDSREYMSGSPCLPAERIMGCVAKRVRSPQTLPAFRKQMSAPAVPPSLKADLPSPGRKSSCPVTASASMLKSSVVSPATSGKFISLPPFSGGPGLLKISSRSPDHSSVSSVSSMSDEVSSDHSSPKLCNAIAASMGRRSITETQYENVSLLPRSSSNSRPSSVSSEKELNYASLDLAPASSDETPRSPHTMKLQQPQNESNEPPLLYAEIDFTKSEGLRHVSGTLREGRL